MEEIKNEELEPTTEPTPEETPEEEEESEDGIEVDAEELLFLPSAEPIVAGTQSVLRRQFSVVHSQEEVGKGGIRMAIGRILLFPRIKDVWFCTECEAGFFLLKGKCPTKCPYCDKSEYLLLLGGTVTWSLGGSKRGERNRGE